MANRTSFLLASLLAWGLVFTQPVQGADPEIEALRIEQQRELDRLRDDYGKQVQNNPNLVGPGGRIDTSHPDYQAILTEYSEEKAKIQSKYTEKDPRLVESLVFESA